MCMHTGSGSRWTARRSRSRPRKVHRPVFIRWARASSVGTQTQSLARSRTPRCTTLLPRPVRIAVIHGVDRRVERPGIITVQVLQRGKHLVGYRLLLRIIPECKGNRFQRFLGQRRPGSAFTQRNPYVSRRSNGDCASWSRNMYGGSFQAPPPLYRFIPVGIPAPFLGVSRHVIRAERALCLDGFPQALALARQNCSVGTISDANRGTAAFCHWCVVGKLFSANSAYAAASYQLTPVTG